MDRVKQSQKRVKQLHDVLSARIVSVIFASSNLNYEGREYVEMSCLSFHCIEWSIMPGGRRNEVLRQRDFIRGGRMDAGNGILVRGPGHRVG